MYRHAFRRGRSEQGRERLRGPLRCEVFRGEQEGRRENATDGCRCTGCWRTGWFHFTITYTLHNTYPCFFFLIPRPYLHHLNTLSCNANFLHTRTHLQSILTYDGLINIIMDGKMGKDRQEEKPEALDLCMAYTKHWSFVMLCFWACSTSLYTKEFS